MATELNDSQHFVTFKGPGAMRTGNAYDVRPSEFTLATMRAAGLLDRMVDDVDPPATNRLWLDKNTDPAVLKEWDSIGSAWMPMTFERIFERAAVTVLTVTGGTANNITVSQPPIMIESRLYSITPNLTSTGAVTIAVAGVGTFQAVYPNGNPIATGEFLQGRPTLLIFKDGKFRILFGYGALSPALEQVAELVEDALEARDQAVAASIANWANVATRALLAVTAVPAVVMSVVVGGYASAGDGGRSQYAWVASEPSHPGKLPRVGGGWWELVESSPSPKMFGAKGDWNGSSGSDDSLAVISWLDYCVKRKVRGVLTGGYYRLTGKVTYNMPVSLAPLSIEGGGRDVSAFVFDCDNGGFDFTLNNGVRSGRNTLTIKGCTFVTTRQANLAGTAISINGNNAEGMTHPGLLIAENLLRGNDANKGWGYGIDILNSTKSTIKDNEFLGNWQGSYEYNATFIRLRGNNLATDHIIENNRSVFTDKGLEITGAQEGFFIAKNQFVATRTGIVRSGDVNSRPLFHIVNNHISAFSTCVYFADGGSQVHIRDNELYEMEVGTGNWVGVALVNVVEFWVKDNTISSFNATRTQRVGIDLNGCGNGFVQSNVLRGTSDTPMLFGISLPSSVTNTKVLDNQFKDVTNRMTGPADGGNVTVKNTYGNFKGVGAISANGDYNITLNHSLGVVPNIDKVQFSVRAATGAMDLLPMQVVSVSSTQSVVKVRVQNFVTAGNVQANVYLEA
ncbi:right-handed parallel beta-helix repeat-containing protein [Endobacterium cereale]|nr:right-handed parallel beta-helix repeat-containing protein [Endobacterium cereale]